jgi:glycosyltransferase involved in cell wall biosynthesis
MGELHGGAETMLWRFLSSADRERIEPTAVFLVPGSLERKIAGLGIPTVLIPETRLRDLPRVQLVVRRLASLYRSASPDVALNWIGKSQIYAGAAAKIAGLGPRVVWWQHGVPDERHWIDRIATLMPAAAIGASSRAAADAQTKIRPRRPVFVVHPGIPEPAAGAPAEVPIPSGRFVVGIAARLQAWKGHHVLVDALAELARRGHDVHGLIVGGSAYGIEPEYADRLRARIRDQDLVDRVHLTGQVEDPTAFVRRMDLLVNVSRRENLSQSILEGMALGVPVLAVGDAGMAEVIEHDRSGVLVSRHDDPAELANAIERLILDRERLERLARGGRARYEEGFTVEAMTARLTEQLESVAAHARSQPQAAGR